MQILFNDTGISGTEVSKLDDFTQCQSFRCNNPSIDLKSMTKSLNRSGFISSSYSFETYLGAGLSNDELIKKLSECTELTRLNAVGLTATGWPTIDLSNTKLEYIYDMERGENWIFPPTFGKQDGGTLWNMNAGAYTFSSNTKIKFLRISSNGEIFSIGAPDILNGLISTGSTVESLGLGMPKDRNAFISFLKSGVLGEVGLKKLYFSWSSMIQMDMADLINDLDVSWYESFSTLELLEIKNLKLYNLNFLQNSSNLTNITLTNCGIQDISGLQSLTNLTNIDLSNNAVTDTYYLRNLKNLKVLNLSNNNLQSNFNYLENGETKSKNNLETLSQLAKSKNLGGALEELYIDGNSILTEQDLSYVRSCTWTKKSGF